MDYKAIVMVVANKVENLLKDVHIKNIGSIDKDLVLLAARSKLNAIESDPNDVDTEVFRFFPHKIQKVLYLRDVEDQTGNGIFLQYSDDSQGFHNELVYVSDEIYNKLCSEVTNVKTLREYKKLLSDFILLMSPEDFTLTLIKSESVIMEY